MSGDATAEATQLPDGLVFTSRLAGLRLLDGEGLPIGRVRDVVILQASRLEPPRALGLIVSVQRRNIFVSLGRIAEMSVDGVTLDGSSVDLERYQQRGGEILASSLYDQPAADGTVLDVGISPSRLGRGGWEVSALAVGERHGRRRQGESVVVPWDAYPSSLLYDGSGQDIAGLRDLNPTDLADAVEAMPETGRRQLADYLGDEELADVLREMPEEDQIGFLAGLGTERIADIIEEMEPDDAVDLLAEMPAAERDGLLAQMPQEQAADLRRLLTYDAATAGGLMTSRPVVVTPDTSVAEALARVRQPARGITEAAQVYVCEPPAATPTGRYLGTVGFQRLLREPPSELVGQCIDDSTFVRPDMPEQEVAIRIAAYNLVAVAVCNDAGSLLGAVTIDDVLDRVLPENWRTGGQWHADNSQAP